MDRMYRYQRHIYDVTRKYYLLGRDTAIRALDARGNTRVLEIACGTGRNLELIHRRYPKARLYGLDISSEMLASARAKFAHLDPQPRLLAADATTFKAQMFGETGFDRILISYALSMIPDWQGAVDASLDALAPGGSLHVVDFGQQERLPGWFGRLLGRWLARFHVTPRADLRQVLDIAAYSRNAKLSFAPVGRGYAWHVIIRK
ncbi:class I SAM-dependent methyltransferase [Rhizobium halophytocola]|nr:class I SAM-dependent methyltransferase [Rhizobium halophytocola]